MGDGDRGNDFGSGDGDVYGYDIDLGECGV